MTPHMPDANGYCTLCDADTAKTGQHCPVAHAFQAWLDSPLSHDIAVRKVMTRNETIIARQAFAAGYWSSK